MTSIDSVFQRWKTTLDQRYQRALNAEFVEKAHENLLAAYASFHDSGCADSQFVPELCSSDLDKSAQRLGEMLLFERLKHAGYHPKPSPNGCGPDFLIHQDGKRICLELITPTTGGDTRIKELFASHDPLKPCPDAATELRERTLLRMTAAVAEKIGKYEGYLRNGVVSSQDVLVIVVNDALLCPDASFYGVSQIADDGVGGQSLAEHAVYGFGHSAWESDNEGKHVLKSTFREIVDNRPEPARDGSARGPVPVSLFKTPRQQEPAEIAERASVISALLQVTLREDYGVLMFMRDKAETGDRLFEGLLHPGVLVVNTRATIALCAPLQHGLMKIVDAPPLSLREAWELKNRELKILLGDGYKEQPFPT